MALIPAFLGLLLLVAIYAGLARLAARLYRRTSLSWKSAFGFGALMSLLALASTILRDLLPLVVVFVGGFTLIIAVGAWFLSTRACDPAGQAIGYRRAAVLSAIAVGMALAVGILLAVVLPALMASEA